MKVFCDNYDCMFIDENGFCDCDKLNIVGGVCVGSYHGSRNATENDADERLKAENANLRELVEDMLFCIEIRAVFGRAPTTDMYEQFVKRVIELGIEVDNG